VFQTRRGTRAGAYLARDHFEIKVHREDKIPPAPPLAHQTGREREVRQGTAGLHQGTGDKG
jgi:hypothetical protein